MTDEELIAAYVNATDSHALEQLIDRHLDSMWRLAYSMVLDHGDADDLVQELFIRVVKSLKSFRGESAFSTWLYRVAMNTAYQFLAKRNKIAKRTENDMSPVMAIDRTTAEDAVACNELDAAIESALAQLSPELRSAIVMTTIEGMSPAELAKAEGVTRATIYWRVHKARSELKKKLSEWLE